MGERIQVRGTGPLMEASKFWECFVHLFTKYFRACYCGRRCARHWRCSEQHSIPALQLT